MITIKNLLKSKQKYNKTLTFGKLGKYFIVFSQKNNSKYIYINHIYVNPILKEINIDYDVVYLLIKKFLCYSKYMGFKKIYVRVYDYPILFKKIGFKSLIKNDCFFVFKIK